MTNLPVKQLTLIQIQKLVIIALSKRRVRNNIHTVLDYDVHELRHNCCSLGTVRVR
jgi:hypothetical protein